MIIRALDISGNPVPLTALHYQGTIEVSSSLEFNRIEIEPDEEYEREERKAS